MIASTLDGWWGHLLQGPNMNPSAEALGGPLRTGFGTKPKSALYSLLFLTHTPFMT